MGYLSDFLRFQWPFWQHLHTFEFNKTFWGTLQVIKRRNFFNGNAALYEHNFDQSHSTRAVVELSNSSTYTCSPNGSALIKNPTADSAHCHVQHRAATLEDFIVFYVS